MSRAPVDLMEATHSESQRARFIGATTIGNRIDSAPVRYFMVLSAAYFFVAFSLSFTKLLWLDELITLHIAHLGGAASIWSALERGADPNPPVTHILVHASRTVFGDHEWAYRLPAILGYWVGLLALYAFLLRRLPTIWALSGTGLSMCMGAFEYSYESRSYGIFYGLAMLAMLCWSITADGSARTAKSNVALCGMILALALGISTNYFAVLAFLPIAGAEAVRTVQSIRRGMDRRFAVHLRVWFGLLLAALPLLAYRGLIAHSIAQFAPYAWNKVSMQQVADSYTEMVEFTLYPILAIFILGIVVWAARGALATTCPGCQTRLSPSWFRPLLFTSRKPLLPLHETVAVLLFMSYPLLGYGVASIRGGMLSPRFVIPVCFGFAIAATFVAYSIFAHTRSAGVIFLSIVTLWFVCRESYIGYWYEEQKQCLYKVFDHLPEAERELPANTPIVIPDPLLALTFQHYAAPDIAKRVVFPIDFPAIRRYRHDDSPEENLWSGRSFLYSMPIETLADFQHSSTNYLIVAADDNWLVNDLRDHNYIVDRLPINTRAAAMGGFTPIARGVPVFFTASWKQTPSTHNHDQPFELPAVAWPVPFREEENLPAPVPVAGGAAQ